MEQLPAYFAKHFPDTIGPELVDYVTNMVFLHSRYLFTRRHGRKQYAYCTHCRIESLSAGFKHGTREQCPSCGSECKVRASGRGRKNLVEEAYLVYYWRSQVNPQAIVARGIHLLRDYRNDYHDVETAYLVKAMYLFEPGRSEMYENWSYYSWLYSHPHNSQNWHRAKTIQSLWNNPFRNIARFCPHDSIAKAVKDSPFQYSTWEQYNFDDMVKFFDLAAKYPCIEYLTKLGFKGVVEAKLYGGRTFKAINWRAKDPLKVLKVSKQDLNELRQSGAKVDPAVLRLFQIQRNDKNRLSVAELDKLSWQFANYHEDLESILNFTSLHRIASYVERQQKTIAGFGSHGATLHTWRDYVNDCHTLGMDLRDQSVLFPRDLHQAHQNTIKQIKVKEDETLRKQLMARQKALMKYRLEVNGLLIRPAKDSAELIAEGKALHHCVGTYAEQYASGKTGIFFIRKASEPDKPFFTIEIRSGQVIQCRGLNNCAMTDEVKAFVDLFKQRKLGKFAAKPRKGEVAV